MKKFFVFIIIACLWFGSAPIRICNAQTDEPQQPYWQFYQGMQGVEFAILDSSMVMIARDWGHSHDIYAMRNTIHMHRFDKEENYIGTQTFNLTQHENIHSLEVFTESVTHSIYRLSNGNFLIGGHGVWVNSTDSMHKNHSHLVATERLSLEPRFEKNGNSNSGALTEDPFMVHPMIFTFNPRLDSLLSVDTLRAVPDHGAITLIHEVAPDTLIIGYHKTNESRQEIMETDSLFNIRWSTEFGQVPAWIANIFDFMIDTDSNYLVSMQYHWQWDVHPLGIWKNILFKFDRHTGELLWEKEVWPGKGYNTVASMEPWQEDKILIALDDCCQKMNPFWFITFHEHTGLHLQVRNNDGDILEEKNLADFLWAFVYSFEGPSAYGDTLEDPEVAHPWFIPYQMIKTQDQGYLISGYQISSPRRTFLRGYLMKVDAQLEPQWARIFEIDKNNYVYGTNKVTIFSLRENDNRIYLAGGFSTNGFWGIPSPLYPPNQELDPLVFIEALFLPLDEHGCYEPGCHLTDNIAAWELEKAIHLNPNPTGDQCRLRISHAELAQKEKVLFISNMQGKSMLTQKFTGSELFINTSAFPEGIYLVYIMVDGKVLKAEKLVKH